jgi:hypothetical protein
MQADSLNAARSGKTASPSGVVPQPAPCADKKYMIQEVNMFQFISACRGKAAALSARVRMAVSNRRGDFYISDAVKVIIAVVLGALLLAAITLLFNDTIIPRITQEIQDLFG